MIRALTKAHLTEGRSNAALFDLQETIEIE
jgi:hypothetical protein